MGFLIDRANGHATGDTVLGSIDTSALASDIAYINWNAQGVASIQYTDRPLVTGIDPSPYQSYLNAWMGAASAMTLTEARLAKCELINAIYLYKRQLPVNVTTSAGNYNWDASDTSSINTTSWITTVNLIIAKVNALCNITANLLSDVSSTVANINIQSSWGIGDPTSGQSAPTGMSALPPPSLLLVPVGGTAPISLTSDDVDAIISAISAQRVAATAHNAAKQAAVNALTTIAAVQAYDATSGW